MTDVPASGSGAVAPFSFLGPDHPLAARLERFRAAVASRGPDVSGATVLADVTLRPEPDAGLVLHRAYWSAQWAGPEGFRATTLDYHATRDRPRWLAFPDDPELPALTDLGGEVLRYMPLRRCTVRAADGVAKVKRPRRAAAAWALLGAVHRAVDHDGDGFVVPAPLAYDPARATYSQTALEGEDLSAIVDDDHLRRAGELHRAMHAADVPGAPPEDPAGALAELRADARWVAFALPEHAGALREVMDVLERRAPPEPHAPAFCHGDLVPSQMLVGARWGITDFDGARIGDPHRDLATWLASLTFDVPALGAAAEAGDEDAVAHAEAAYLDGYGAHDEGRLLWHRAAAEVHYAAVALKKDRYHPARLARALRLAGACAETLR
jgi:aminoglycoside phosphotransferase (APT) family kinase protein